MNAALSKLEQEWQDRFGNERNNTWLLEIRQNHFEAFSKLGFPTTKNEQWKYTNLASFKGSSLSLGPKQPNNLSRAEIEPFLINDQYYRLVFIDGFFASDLSLIPEGNALTIKNLKKAFRDNEVSLKELFTSKDQGNAFLHLNTACVTDGIFITVPAGNQVQKPLHLLFISTQNAANSMHNTRNIILIEPQATVTLIEEHVSMHSSTYVTNTRTQIYADKESKVAFIKLQNQNKNSFHIANTEITQKINSQVNTYSYSLGSQLAREDIHCFLNERGASFTLHGLYLPLQKQHIDVHSWIYHNADNTMSEEIFKGIVGKKSAAVFNGLIKVGSNLKQAVANLQNKNLLLSKDSEINTKPELEIYSNDVKCHHGATVGSLDLQMLFYLRSRGLPKKLAYQLLLLAFIDEQLNFPPQEFRKKIKQLITSNCEEVYE